MKRLARILCMSLLSASLCLSPGSFAFAESAAIDSSSPAAAQESSAQNPDSSSAAKTDGILITLDATASAATREQAQGNGAVPQTEAVHNLEAAGVTVEGATMVGNSVLLTARPTNGDDRDALSTVANIAGVAAVQPNYVYDLVEPIGETLESNLSAQDGAKPLSLSRLTSLIPVNDAFTQTSGAATDTNNQYWAYDAKLIGAWREAKTDNEVTIAVLDSGVRYDHRDLQANVLVDLAYDSFHQEEIGGTGDALGHGTHVAGIAAGVSNNGIGISGASYNANILPVKVINDENRATSASLAAAYAYLFALVDSGMCPSIHVVNLSLGGYEENGMNDEALHNVIRQARKAYRIATVAAGGNYASSEPFYPSDWDEVISVSALNSDGTYADLNNTNANKDIDAPGMNIWSTWNANASSYKLASGTSMASPLVAGTVAMMFAVNPAITVDEVEDALYSTAGYVESQPKESGSHGSINARAAIDKVIDESRQAASFPDVTGESWYNGPVAYVSRRGIMHGFSDTGLFLPEANITREQAATVLYNYLGNGEIAPKATLRDINQNDYYANAVNWAIYHRIMNGYSGTELFGVGNALTREELATVFANMLATEDELAGVDMSGLEAMPDNEQTDVWARASMAWAINKGIISGFDNDGVRYAQPLTPASRAVMAAIVSNAITSDTL